MTMTIIMTMIVIIAVMPEEVDLMSEVKTGKFMRGNGTFGTAVWLVVGFRESMDRKGTGLTGTGDAEPLGVAGFFGNALWRPDLVDRTDMQSDRVAFEAFRCVVQRCD